MNKEIIIQNTEGLNLVADELLEFLNDRKVIGFYGEIGAGKTTLVKVLCKKLGSTDNVNSPTFGLINEYDSTNGTIFHLDLYRLKDIDEALGIGIEDYIYDGDYCLVEWPELIENLLPEDAVKVRIENLGETVRKFSFEK